MLQKVNPVTHIKSMRFGARKGGYMGNGVKLGRSKFTIGFLAAFLIGIFLADLIPSSFLFEGILLGLIIIAGYFFYQDKTKFLFLFIFSGFILGLTYYHYWDFLENKKTVLYDQLINFRAQVIENPSVSGNNQQIILGYEKTKILVQTAKFPKYQYGDILEITAKIENPAKIRPINDFDYGNFLLKKEIRGQIKNPDKIVKVATDGNIIIKKIYQLGDRFQQSISKVLPEPYAAFQVGLLFGNKTNIPDSLMSAFNRTGTTHIVAVSGYNVTIIISALALIMAGISRKLTFYGTIFAIIFFVILTGAGASVLRAGLLAGLVAWGRLSGRRPYYTILILIAAWVLILFNPYMLKNDISFQLSFLAFIGLFLISPIFENLKLIKNWPTAVKITLAQTLGAQILVLPILLYNFGTLSIIAPLTNILVLPIIPVAMLAGFLSAIATLIYLKLGLLFGAVAFLFLKYIIIVVEKLSLVSWAALSLKTTEWWWIPIYYTIIIVLIQKFNLNLSRQAKAEMQNEKSKI